MILEDPSIYKCNKNKTNRNVSFFHEYLDNLNRGRKKLRKVLIKAILLMKLQSPRINY